MNIIPFVLALALMISLMTIERLEKFKNKEIVQIEYKNFLENEERKFFNLRQQRLFGLKKTSHRRLSFRYFIDKDLREKKAAQAQQSRLITIEFLKIVYGHTAFYKELERRRPNFIEEMLDAIEEASDAMPEKSIKRVEDIPFIQLDDPELQEAFYHMLKGTISRDKLVEAKKMEPEKRSARRRNIRNRRKKTEEQATDQLILTPQMVEKAYPSLLTYININEKRAAIEIQKAPRELLKAIFGNDEVVEAIILKRNEYAESKTNGAAESFKNEFKDKRRPGLDESLLDFQITFTNKSKYD